MLAPLFFTNSFGWYGNKKGNYNRHSMLSFTLFMVVSSEDLYLSVKDKYQTFYVSSSCIFHDGK